jgi:hypothetical protein
VSIGDVSCQKLCADGLNVQDNVLIVEDGDERKHKANCERAYTLLYQHFNCVISIEMAKTTGDQSDTQPLSISNLQDNILEQHEDGLKFDQNTVPFDFDGHNLIWLAYLENNSREIKSYNIDTRENKTLIIFPKGAGIISHCKLAKKNHYSADDPIKLVYAQNTSEIVIYNS